MITVQQLMQMKADTETYFVAPTDPVSKALKVMAEKNTGAVMVMNNGQMVGIFTERDFARKALIAGKCSMDTDLEDVMTHEMITIHPEQSLEECMELMNKHHIRHLPVLASGRLVGMVSMRDVFDLVLSQKENTIQQLQSYILGEGYGM